MSFTGILNRYLRSQTLELSDTQVTDAGLDNLKGLKDLKLVFLGGTQVSHAGIEKLLRALPKCEVAPTGFKGR